MCVYFFLCCKISIGKNDAKEIMKEREVMYKIAYVVPFFGKFPKGFEFWLLSCKCNPTIDWLIFTDDQTPYDYPENVKVTYF